MNKGKESWLEEGTINGICKNIMLCKRRKRFNVNLTAN
jgi:hypothetical protein